MIYPRSTVSVWVIVLFRDQYSTLPNGTDEETLTQPEQGSSVCTELNWCQPWILWPCRLVQVVNNPSLLREPSRSLRTSCFLSPSLYSLRLTIPPPSYLVHYRRWSILPWPSTSHSSMVTILVWLLLSPNHAHRVVCLDSNFILIDGITSVASTLLPDNINLSPLGEFIGLGLSTPLFPFLSFFHSTLPLSSSRSISLFWCIPEWHGMDLYCTKPITS